MIIIRIEMIIIMATATAIIIVEVISILFL